MKLTDESKIFLGIVVATLAIISAAVFFFSQPAKPEQTLKREELITADTHVTGNASASAYLVEFSDYQCPSCKAVAPTVQEIIKEYKDSLAFAYHHFPLEQHAYAIPAAIAAEAAGKQGKFWEMTDAIFAQDQDKFSDEMMKQLATDLGLNIEQFEKDIKDSSLRDKVIADRGLGITVNIQATPTFFLNGQKLELTSFAELKTKVTESLKQ